MCRAGSGSCVTFAPSSPASVATRSPRHRRQRCRSRAVAPGRGCSRMWSFPSSPTTCRSTASPGSMRAKASSSAALRSPTGWARSAGCSNRWSTGSPSMSWAASSSTLTTRRFRCSPPAPARPRPGRLWVYLRDNRRWRPGDKPAALFRYSRDRKGDHPREQLKAFTGFLQADAYAGFDQLYLANRQPRQITAVACWAHARRKLHEVHKADETSAGSEGLRLIQAMYEIERGITCDPHDDRRQARKLSGYEHSSSSPGQTMCSARCPRARPWPKRCAMR